MPFTGHWHENLVKYCYLYKCKSSGALTPLSIHVHYLDRKFSSGLQNPSLTQQTFLSPLRACGRTFGTNALFHSYCWEPVEVLVPCLLGSLLIIRFKLSSDSVLEVKGEHYLKKLNFGRVDISTRSPNKQTSTLKHTTLYIIIYEGKSRSHDKTWLLNDCVVFWTASVSNFWFYCLSYCHVPP